jgi:hypothetical protein
MTVAALVSAFLIRRAAAAFFWRVADKVDYLVTLARLRILEVVCGPAPETPANQWRERDRERLKRAFPEIEPWGKPSPRSPASAGHLTTMVDYRTPRHGYLIRRVIKHRALTGRRPEYRTSNRIDG